MHIHTRTHTHTCTSNRTPLDEWSARCRGRYVHDTQKNKRDQSPRLQRDSNPRSQQSRVRSLTPLTRLTSRPALVAVHTALLDMLRRECLLWIIAALEQLKKVSNFQPSWHTDRKFVLVSSPCRGILSDFCLSLCTSTPLTVLERRLKLHENACGCCEGTHSYMRTYKNVKIYIYLS